MLRVKTDVHQCRVIFEEAGARFNEDLFWKNVVAQALEIPVHLLSLALYEPGDVNGNGDR